jgi:hypothetical protein
MSNAITMGYEGQVFQGPAGSTATNQITNARDMKTTHDPQMGDTTTRGTGAAPPIETEAPATVKWSLSLNMVNNINDTNLQAILAAHSTNTPIAIRTKNYSSGKGFDGDCNVKAEMGAPLKSEETWDFTFTPNGNYRQPNLWT